MTEAFEREQPEDFLVFELEDTGERTKLNITQSELKGCLNPEQVFIIIREDLRRIFIWKGSKSTVRKRFISSRVAQQLQKELMEDQRYHRCKIVSIDQGDELQEFLNAFKLESMEVTDRLPDMHYIRNAERDRMGVYGQIKQTQGISKGDPSDILKSEDFSGLTPASKKFVKQKPPQRFGAFNYKYGGTISMEERKKIKEEIISSGVPENYERQNLIIGHTLFGTASKVVEVFGKNVTETTWEEIKKVPQTTMELDGYKLKVHFNDEKGIVKAVEVLKYQGGNGQLNSDDKTTTSKTNRRLPKIPSNQEN